MLPLVRFVNIVMEKYSTSDVFKDTEGLVQKSFIFYFFYLMSSNYKSPTLVIGLYVSYFLHEAS